MVKLLNIDPNVCFLLSGVWQYKVTTASNENCFGSDPLNYATKNISSGNRTVRVKNAFPAMFLPYQGHQF